MRPFFPYYGSAWRKARRGFYPAPEHGLVVEPLAGAAGYVGLRVHALDAMHFPLTRQAQSALAVMLYSPSIPASSTASPAATMCRPIAA